MARSLAAPASVSHTPGPWRVVTRLGFYKPKSKVYVVGEEINPALASTPDACEHAPLIAEIEYHRFGSADRWPVAREEQDANARLIASAPDLLAACEALLPIVESMDDGDGDGLPSCVVAARLALARARGQS